MRYGQGLQSRPTQEPAVLSYLREQPQPQWALELRGFRWVLQAWVGAWRDCGPPLGCAEEGVQALGKKGFLRAK